MRPPASRSYARMLWLLRGREPEEQQAIKDAAELIAKAQSGSGI